MPVNPRPLPRDPDAPKRTRLFIDLAKEMLDTFVSSGFLVQTPGPSGGWTINPDFFGRAGGVIYLAAEDGEQGERGWPGPAGSPGVAGSAGPQGSAGPPGYRGEDGEDGLWAVPGPRGATGATGATGASGGGAALFSHFDTQSSTDVSGGFNTFYTDTMAAGQLASDGDSLQLRYAGTFSASATATRRVVFRFDLATAFDSGVLTVAAGGSWVLDGEIVREDAATIRCNFTLSTSGLTDVVSYTTPGVFVLSSAMSLQLIGVADGVGAAAGDVTAEMGTVRYTPAP